MFGGAPLRTSQRSGSDGTPHVALLVETTLASGRDILSGISKFLREHHPWALYHEPRSLEEGLPGWLEAWKGDGIIVRAQTRGIADAVKATGLPVVDVLGVVPEAGLPLVHVDNALIAQMAVEHLVDKGFHHFGYFGIRGENWSESRRDGLLRVLGMAADRAILLEVPRSDIFQTPWEFQQDDLAGWLMGLPKPIGIMVASDQLGPPLLEACHRAGIKVPDEVAVIGVDNDATLCDVCNPSLSSVDAGHREVGYRAAELLDLLMAGNAPGTGPTLIRPKGIVARRSSDVTVTGDPHVASALRLIREHACEGWSAARVVERIPLSRSVLQRRFRQETGRSIQEEIIRTRLRKARELLAETDQPLIDVAVRAGFKHQEYLGLFFRSILGKTPAEYRREIRGPGVRKL
jgi:LacI family transcriptional regulator